jgi:hypothetical protein
MPAPDPAPWLTNYIARHLREAGVVDDDTARRMSADIAAAFATLARLDQAGVVLDS